MANELRLIKGYSASEMLTYMGKILCRYLMQITPPFDAKDNPFGQNVWAKQKKTGEKAVRRDFSRAFQLLTPAAIDRVTHNIGKRQAHWLKLYARQGLMGKLNTMLRDLKLPHAVKVIRFVSTDLARSNVFFGSRPHRIKQKYLVLDAGSIKRELTLAISHLGRAKAGWLPAAMRLGVKAPQWVIRHEGAASGRFIDQRHDRLLPSVTMINSTEGADAKNLDVVGAATREFQRSGLQRQLEAIWNKRARRLNGGQKQLPART